jgi:hypothetical protein
MSIIEKIKALHELVKGINPTIIYNEGWIIRLLVEESIRAKIKVKNIDFSKMKNWTSEAKISSPFEGAELKSINKNETKTQTDIILGDFPNPKFGETGGSEVKAEKNAEILGIIEAKMGSSLSQGIKKAEKYNQASRSISCLAHATKESPKCEIFFAVVAPHIQIEKSKFKEQINNVEEEIKGRFISTKGIVGYTDDMREKVKNCKKLIISYEEWISKIEDNDVKKAVVGFYEKCIKYNKINEKFNKETNQQK